MKVANTQEVQSHVSTVGSDKLTVVDCFTTWCAPCKAIKPVMDKLSAELTDVTFLAVDIDNNPEFASKMNVRSVPTLLFFKGETVVQTVRGLQKEQAVRDILSSLSV